MAQETDERVGRRDELVPGHACRRASEGHRALRTVDGALLHRRQHRRRYRARGPCETREVLRCKPRHHRRSGAHRARDMERPDRFQRHRDRAQAHRRRPRAAVDQPARHLQLPQRIADVQRRRAGRVRRVDLGQFFIYQGFYKHIGWMHTSTGVDAVDEFAETVSKKNGKYFYKFGDKELPVTNRDITIRYRTDDGSIKARTFTAYFTKAGPIVAEENGKWIAEALMNRPIPALEQSWLRTKATDLASYMKVAELKANSSNNTLFADDKGEIAFLAPQFIPKRDNAFDYLEPVDGSNPATAWQGMTPLKDMPNSID